jgi:hypothetical protein
LQAAFQRFGRNKTLLRRCAGTTRHNAATLRNTRVTLTGHDTPATAKYHRAIVGISRIGFVTAVVLLATFCAWPSAGAADAPRAFCRHQRESCLDEMARECPGGFVIVEEQDGYNADPHMMGHWWRIWYGCAPPPATGTAGTAAVVPPADAARQLLEFDEHIEALRDEARRTTSKGKPILYMAVGYGVGALGLALGLSGLSAEPETDPLTGERTDVTGAHRLGGVMLAVAAGGLALGIYGNVLLLRRSRARRVINQEIARVEAERRAYRYQLHYGVAPLSSRLEIRLTF